MEAKWNQLKTCKKHALVKYLLPFSVELCVVAPGDIWRELRLIALLINILVTSG